MYTKMQLATRMVMMRRIWISVVLVQVLMELQKEG